MYLFCLRWKTFKIKSIVNVKTYLWKFYEKIPIYAYALFDLFLHFLRVSYILFSSFSKYSMSAKVTYVHYDVVILHQKKLNKLILMRRFSPEFFFEIFIGLKFKIKKIIYYYLLFEMIFMFHLLIELKQDILLLIWLSIQIIGKRLKIHFFEIMFHLSV